MPYNTGNPVGSKSPKDLIDNSENLDKFSNGDAYEYPDRLGRNRKSMKWIQDAALAIPAIDAAIRSEQQADRSKTEADRSGAARVGAESARDAALMLAGIYANTAAGLVATTPGKVFGVPVANDLSSVILYENRAGVAVDTGARLPSAEAVVAAALYAASLVSVSTPKLRNLFDKTMVVPGKTVSVVNGTEAANATYLATGYIPVLGGGAVTFNRANSSNSVFGYDFYDFKKKFISGMPSTTVPAGTAIAVPSGAAYIRGTFLTSTNTRLMMAVNGSTMPVDFIDFELPEDLRVRKLLAESQLSTLGNLNIFDRTAIADESILANNVVSALAGHYITPYMGVVQNSQITFNIGSGLSATYGVHFYDKDLVYISVSAAPVEATPVVVPAGAAFARTTFRKATAPAAALMAVRGSTLPASYVGFGLPSQDETLELSRNITRSYARPLNLFDSVLATDGFLLGTLGVPQASANYAYTGYMPVLSGGEITVGSDFAAGSVYGMHFYDKNKALLSTISAPFTAGRLWLFLLVLSMRDAPCSKQTKALSLFWKAMFRRYSITRITFALPLIA
ncbi:hypothetical protein [Pseudomonas fluorescens]|uniref:Uncharacterized protein n=1 Tax=Pseudomonas fluorescens TaxID=294 RepID=A0A5E7VTK5_PSEFL|nr:hypothetical protein [Pseudomonas fluorescens]VVQ25984.1 hypothetical protein PS928_06297 [Pseudomonas fluorescens]